MKILIVGAGGLLGRTIGAGLVQRQHTVRGLVRPGSPKAAELQTTGMEILAGDLKDAASLARACEGMDTVISTATAVLTPGNSLAAVDRDGHLALVAAAVKAKVEKFVYVSVSPNLPDDCCELVRHKRKVERAIRASGLKWTILQPAPFMEIWLGPPLGWDLPAGKAQSFGAGTAPISWVSLEDVAAYAMASVTEPKSDNQDIPIGGPTAMTTIEVMQTFEQISRRKFKLKKIPGLMPKIMSVILRPFKPKLASLMALGVETMKGEVIDLTKARAIFGLPGISVAEFGAKRL